MLTDHKPIDELGFSDSTERYQNVASHILSVLTVNHGRMGTQELLSQNNNQWSLSEMRVSLSILHLHRRVYIDDTQRIVTIAQQ